MEKCGFAARLPHMQRACHWAINQQYMNKTICFNCTNSPACCHSCMEVSLGPESQQAYCRICQTNVTTNAEFKASTKTHLLALLLCVFGCCPCACCLYCTGCARNVEHYCPTCNTYLGVYER